MTKKMGFFGKKSFSSYVDYRCDRKLYLDLGNHDDRWVQRDILIRSGKSDLTKETMKLGKEYESNVYQRLMNLFPEQIHAKIINSSIVQKRLTKDVLHEIYASVQKSGQSQIGLELEFEMVSSFVHSIFDSDEHGDFPTLGNQNPRKCRPDILVFGPLHNDAAKVCYELCSNGETKIVSSHDKRIGISIIDIKNSQHDRIGLRHFSELIFYAYALRFFLDTLESKGCSSLFYVCVSGHSILGRLDLDSLTDNIDCITWSNPSQLSSDHSIFQLAPMVWNETHELFVRFRMKAQELWGKANEYANVDCIDVHMQKKCARCPFIDDCVHSLSNGKPDPSSGFVRDWDIRLLPLLKMDVAQQIIDFGKSHNLPSLRTIGNLYDNLETMKLNLGDVPTPLHAEINTLKMRLEALMFNRTVMADDGYFSKYLPNQINMALIFNLEKEDLHDIVFAYSLQFSIIAPLNHVNRNLRVRHCEWWNTWIDIITKDLVPDWESLLAILDLEILFFTNFYYDTKEKFEALDDDEKQRLENEFNTFMVKQLQSFHTCMTYLYETGGLNLKKNGIKRVNEKNHRREEPLVSLNINSVGLGFEKQHEYSLVEDFIDIFYHVMKVCIITEKLTLSVKNTREGRKKSITHESFAGFYWSAHQVDTLRELLERHLETIRVNQDKSSNVYHKFTQILQWFAPSESGVLNYKFFEKVYNIELFLRHAVAFPQIIAYSWHELIQIWKPDFTPNNRYWIPHYNFIDFTSWYSVLGNLSNARKLKLEVEKISEQLKIKMNALDTLLFELYRKSKETHLLPPESVTISSSSFLENRTERYNAVARAWYSYSKLNGMVSEVEAGVYRNTWTDYSVAKLRAGAVTSFSIEEGPFIPELDLKISEDKSYDYTPTTIVLLLKDISSNMKIKKGDRVQLLHEGMRDSYAHWLIHKNTSQFNVTSIIWDKGAQGYQVKGFINTERMHSTHMKKRQFPSLNNYQVWKKLYELGEVPTPNIFSMLVQTQKQGWHVHQQESDIWSQRLQSILKSGNIGKSWLGDMFALERDLHDSLSVDAAAVETTSAKEVYLYRPSILPDSQWKMEDSLRTQIKYAPDPSQIQAIKESLRRTVSCIQGPPGTGKSQTIIALLDEYTIRFQEKFHRKPKILISAFSYAALEVLINKLYDSREGDGIEPDKNQLSHIAKMPVVFASSTGRNMPELKEIHPSQSEPISFQRCSYSGSWLVNGNTVNRRKWSRSPKKLHIFGHLFHMTSAPIEENPYIEPLQENKKKKTKAAIKKETDALIIKQIQRNDSMGFVLFANAHFLYNLGRTHPKKRVFEFLQEDFGFDLVIIDEASQMPADHFSAISRLVHNQSLDICIDPIFERVITNDKGEKEGRSCAKKESELSLGEETNREVLTQVVLVGDHNQLPPIQQVKPSEKLKPIVGSIFEYFMEAHGVHKSQLNINYRSHKDIVYCIQKLEIYERLASFQGSEWRSDIKSEHLRLVDEAWIQEILNPDHAVVTVVHNSQYDTALSTLEGEIVSKIVLQLYRVLSPKSEQEELHFWQEIIGIVAPHNAHANIISRNLLLSLDGLSLLSQTKLKECLDTTIYSVEKFQGSDRSVIIGSMGVSSMDQLQTEEEFLYNMNRFNVLISRAKHKMIFVCSKNYTQYVPQKPELMKVALQVRTFTYEICNQSQDHEILTSEGKKDISIRIKK